MISKRAITGVDITVLVACGARTKLVTTQALSEATGLSVSNLEQVLKQLRDNNIVKSTKGPGGGYQLSADLEQLTVLDLVRIFDKSQVKTKSKNDQSAQLDLDPVEDSFVSLVEEFLSTQRMNDLVSSLPQWIEEPAMINAGKGRFKLKEPPARLIPRSPNSVFQLSDFMSTAVFG